ncbi:MAG TPA: bifunctional serine/threonine-protein kinase/formylglycine-generating enzyme family protein [Planctomycetota bacterium]|jgi:formylglycine-generating enzyme required for sulfatase activity/serine/threonine protein kinase
MPESKRTDVPAIPPEDLTSDPLLLGLPRVELHNLQVPVLGKIPLLSRLGKGAMGAVYYAIHPRLKIEVAIKILQAFLARQDPGIIERFYREAQSAARVSSRHLVHVSDVDEESGLFYIVMEYVCGVSASQFLKKIVAAGQVGLDEAAALDIIIAATKGLAAAHNEGIIHRDVKPGNIMIPCSKTGGGYNLECCKLADLGLARPEGQDSGLTGAYQTIGTPGYMAPEQIEDAAHAGKPADVFSMGAALYALLGGAPPFSGTSQMLVLSKTITEPHDPIDSRRSDLSLATTALLERCLAKEPARRYADGPALLDALKQCRASLGSGPRAASTSDETSVLTRAPRRTRVARRTLVKKRDEPGTLPEGKTQLSIPPRPEASPVRVSNTATVGTAGAPVPQPSVSAPVASPAGTAISVGAVPGVPPPPALGGMAVHTFWPFDRNEASRRRAALSKDSGLPECLTLMLPGGLRLGMVLVPPGKFLMGSPHSEEFRDKDEPSHYVQMNRAFYIGSFPVTQEQWLAVTGTNFSRFKDLPDSATRPVERVSWIDVQEKFIAKVQAQASPGWKLRLPTEAEWEYACRAGTETPFYFGQSISLNQLNCKAETTSGSDWKWVYQPETAYGGVMKEKMQTVPIGSYAPNPWSLYEMHGNVWEWCEDWYDASFYLNEPAVNPCNLAAGEERVLRGGGWNYTARYCRSACRYHSAPDTRNFSVGFRLVLGMA